jgi:hypothetical protein
MTPTRKRKNSTVSRKNHPKNSVYVSGYTWQFYLTLPLVGALGFFIPLTINYLVG